MKLRMILAARVANTLRHYLGTQGRDVRREEAPVLNLDHSSMQIDQFLDSGREFQRQPVLFFAEPAFR